LFFGFALLAAKIARKERKAINIRLSSALFFMFIDIALILPTRLAVAGHRMMVLRENLRRLLFMLLA